MWVHYLLMAIVPALQSTVKNPKSLAKEKGLLIQARDTINVLLASMEGNE